MEGKFEGVLGVPPKLAYSSWPGGGGSASSHEIRFFMTSQSIQEGNFYYSYIVFLYIHFFIMNSKSS